MSREDARAWIDRDLSDFAAHMRHRLLLDDCSPYACTPPEPWEEPRGTYAGALESLEWLVEQMPRPEPEPCREDVVARAADVACAAMLIACRGQRW